MIATNFGLDAYLAAFTARHTEWNRRPPDQTAQPLVTLADRPGATQRQIDRRRSVDAMSEDEVGVNGGKDGIRAKSPRAEGEWRDALESARSAID